MNIEEIKGIFIETFKERLDKTKAVLREVITEICDENCGFMELRDFAAIDENDYFLGGCRPTHIFRGDKANKLDEAGQNDWDRNVYPKVNNRIYVYFPGYCNIISLEEMSYDLLLQVADGLFKIWDFHPESDIAQKYLLPL